MNVNPDSLKKLWEIQKQYSGKSRKRILDSLRKKEYNPHQDTDYVNQMQVTDRDTQMDPDLQGEGGSSLGVGIPNLTNDKLEGY